MGGFISSIISRKKRRQQIQRDAVKEAPAGPTISELEQSETDRLLRNKRKGRKSTKLAQADDELTLSKKTLLG